MSALASKNIVSPCFIYNGVLIRHLPDNPTGLSGGESRSDRGRVRGGCKVNFLVFLGDFLWYRMGAAQWCDRLTAYERLLKCWI